MPTEEPSPKRVKLSMTSYAEPLKILVGKDRQPFHFQKGVICANSGFFQAACNNHWESGRTNTVTLEFEQPEVFILFMAWLSTGDMENAIEYSEISGKPKTPERDDSVEALFLQLSQYFVLGHLLQAADFQNTVIDKCLHLCKLTGEGSDFLDLLGSQDTVRYTFTETTPKSPLRQLLIDQFVKYIDLERIKVPDFSIPAIGEFYFQAVLSVMIGRGKSVQAPWQKDPCAYHIHPSQPEGYSCTKNASASKSTKSNKRT